MRRQRLGVVRRLFNRTEDMWECVGCVGKMLMLMFAFDDRV